MKARDFVYWAQGFFELAELSVEPGEPLTLNARQVECFKNHLAMVFKHEIDPSFPEEQQESLNAAHEGKKPVTQEDLEHALKNRPPPGGGGLLRC